MRRLMSGARRQKRTSRLGRTVARVSAASGPSSGAAPGTNGIPPLQEPRAEVGTRNTVQASRACAR